MVILKSALNMSLKRHRRLLRLVFIVFFVYIVQRTYYYLKEEEKERRIISGNIGHVKTRKDCHLAIISTYPPRKCGIAEFTRNFVTSLRVNQYFAASCSYEILALVDPKQARGEDLHFEDPLVTPIILDNNVPSKSFWNCALYINQGGFTHAIIEQEFGLTPIMWQLVDLARWMKNVKLISVIHTPRAYPNIEETGLLRQLAKFSDYMIVMSWHAKNSLHRAYGIDQSKILFIPHGVKLPTNIEQQQQPLQTEFKETLAHRNLSKLKPSDLLILTNGLIHRNKGLDRLVRNLPTIIKKHPNVYFFVVGREHPSNSDIGLMEKLLKKAETLGVLNNLVWVNEFVSEEELSVFYKRTDLYVTLFDEITPTSGTLLTAMANGLAIISTPYRFAIEMLSSDRGMIVPFENDVELSNSVIKLIENPSMRQIYGKRAQEFVSVWSWDNVASQYVDLMLDRYEAYVPVGYNINGNKVNLGNKLNLEKKLVIENENNSRKQYNKPEPYFPLTQNPFASEPSIEILTVPAMWSSTEIRTFDQKSLSPKGEIHTGVYVVYVDNDIQINAKVESNLLLASVGIKTKTKWIYVHWSYGVDFEEIISTPTETQNTANTQNTPNSNAKNNAEEENITIDLAQKSVVVYSKNVVVSVKVTQQSGVSITFMGANRFASPHGLLGDTLRCKHDLSASQLCTNNGVEGLNWKSWFISSGFLFSHEASGQNWSLFGINLNIVQHMNRDLSNSGYEFYQEDKKINFVIEGPIFSKEGFAVVNRKMWFLLESNPNFQVILRPTDTIGTMEAMQNLDVYLVHSAYKEQLKEIQKAKTEGLGYFSKPSNIIVIFRNAWPPNFNPPHANVVWIHQQPWEFVGIPFEWKVPLINNVDDLWVPSLYCKESYIMNGIPLDKITVIPHGVSHEKFALVNEVYKLNTTKTFKFLFIGGLLPRKGIDILLKSYKEAFKRTDDVVLVIHSIYGDNFAYEEIQKMQNDPSAPEIQFLQEPMSWYKLATLYRAANVYISPYRSEGFGLTILESMACKVPPLVPMYGPALEFCTEDNAYFVNSSLTKCLIPPCGEMEIFGKPTVVQPQWSEINQQSLTKMLQKAVHDSSRTVKGTISRQIAERHGWRSVGELMTKRIYKLVERKYGVIYR